jgi:SAM-dependent methyltransferase
VLDNCAPGAIVAVDPAPAQIAHARQQPAAQRAEFRVADAMALPFPDGGFDVVTSALVINFIPATAKGLSEMRRVARPGGTVAGYVWDRTPAAELSPTAPMQRALRDIGAEVPRIPGADMGSLTSLFATTGFEGIDSTSIEVTQTYRNFDDYWEAQTPAFSPAAKIIAALPQADRARLRDVLRAALPPGPDGSIIYAARANGIKARVPG